MRLINSLRQSLLDCDQLMIEKEKRHKAESLEKQRAAERAAQELLEEVDREVHLRRKSSSGSSDSDSSDSSSSSSSESDVPIRFAVL